MIICYKRLWKLLLDKEISKQTMRERCNISSGTMTKLNKGENVSLDVLLKICAYLQCNIGDICDAVKKK